MNSGGFWVFGYGSLMWRPDFRYAERRLADLPGHRRRFCVLSVRYRGTETAPGLVLGLDAAAGAVCRGVAYRVAAEDAAEAHACLTARELVTRSYLETRRTIRLTAQGGGEASEVESLCYVVDRAHRQYAGELSLEAQAAVIARAVGPAGPNCVYLHNTVAHLVEMGVRDPELERLDAMVRALGCARAAGEQV